MDKENPIYESFLPQWKYLLASYQGGNEYRSSSLKMLRKYIGEEELPGNQYGNRLEYTALDNLVKLTIDTYRSFLFRTQPVRTFGAYKDHPMVQRFTTDIDFEGKNLDDFMKEANDMASVYGNVWIMVTKGYMEGVVTLDQEIANDLRPYAKIFTPENVIDWQYEKQPNGAEKLVYLKTQERIDHKTVCYIEWTPTEIKMIEVVKDEHEEEMITKIDIQVNAIGRVPFYNLKANPSAIKGVGMSDMADVAKIQQQIFNLISEAEQGIRISNHPTLVKPTSTSAQAGAGSVIDMDENTDPGLVPYLLEPNGTNIESINTMIESLIQAFLRNTHLGAVMAARGLTVKSGVALSTEFQQLNTRLGDKAAKLEQAEENIWELFWSYSGLTPDQDFSVEYTKSFDLRDEHADLKLYSDALALDIPSVQYKKSLYKQIAKLTIVDGDELDMIMDELNALETLPEADDQED